MAKTCKLFPDEGKELFNNLKQKFGYNTAWDIWAVTKVHEFMKGKNFKTDSEGFPEMEDLLKDRTVQKLIGIDKFKKGLEKQFSEQPDTNAGYTNLVNQAHAFNSKAQNSDYIATVIHDANVLRIKVNTRNKYNEQEAKEQYATNTLNNRISDILNPIGINIDNITEAEEKAGRVGVTDFTAINSIADSSVNVIRIANNMEGTRAISEEFSHLVIGSYRKTSLVKRALNALKNEKVLKAVLGDEYDKIAAFEDHNIDLIAEEALGKLLQENLLAEVSNNPNSISTLLDRLYSNIKGKFKNIDIEEIQKAVFEANGIMGQLAKGIISGNKKLERKDVLSSESEAQFNSLSERIEANINILKELKDIEVKRFKISPKSSVDEIADRKKIINELSLLSKGEKDTRIGILNYSRRALNDLRGVKIGLEARTLAGHPSYASIRRAKSYVQSYAGFIEKLRQAIFDSKTDEEVPDFLTNIELKDGTVVNMTDIVDELAALSGNIVSLYNKYSTQMIIEFFRPFYGNDIVMTAGRHKGETVSIESIVKEASQDISIGDAIFDSMADSSDAYLQLFDRVIKNANDNVRLATIDSSREVQRLMKSAEEDGINDFEWIFEKDSHGNKSGNYISSINYALFYEERDAKRAELIEKYGEKATGIDARNKVKEYNEWLKNNADDDNRENPKNIDKYRNQDFINLDEKHKKFYKEFMRMKLLADARFPDTRVESNKAIQMRKTSSNRVIESLSNPSSLVDNIKESIKKTFLESADDDTLFGEAKTGLTNFDNTEYMTLPVLYTNRLEDPNELSTDIFASLINYQFVTNTYAEMDAIVDPLEIARSLVVDKQRKVIKTRSGNPLLEKINAAGESVVNKIIKEDSNIETKLNNYIESNLYQRHMKDAGNILGVSISKTGNWLLHMSSLAQIGFNFLANSSNVFTGIAMGNIEAGAGEYFNARQLAAADRSYFGLMGEFISELGSRTKTNKLSLFDELFNVKIDYKQQIKNNKKRGILQKMFGESIAYIGQEGGDHWLYNRVAIARCKAIQVLVPKTIKKVKRVKGLKEAEKVVENIIKNSEEEKLTEDNKFYQNTQTGVKSARVTKVIQAENPEHAFKETHDDGTPNNWITPSTNIGTGIDVLVRDFFDGLLFEDEKGEWHHDNKGDAIEEIYPNMTKEDISSFLKQLYGLKNEFYNKGLTVVPKDVVARGKLTIKNGDKNSYLDLNVAGTLDLLAYDKNGDFYIYDMKTHRGKVSNEKKSKWSAQLSLYKKLLQKEYNINVKSLHIIPIKVNYNTPEGEISKEIDGTSKYTAKEGSNQLYENGKEFKDSRPYLEQIIDLNESTLNLEYNDVQDNKEALNERNLSNYNKMSLWEALEVQDVYDDREDIKKMVVPEGTLELNGDLIDIKKISRQIQQINIHLLGAYNDEDSNAANRLVLGRAVQQFRKWIKPQFNLRFQEAQINVLEGNTKEGYYRTFAKYYGNKFFGRFISEAERGKIQIAAHWDELSDEERYNIKRAWTEFIQCLCIYLVAVYAPWPDDKKRPWALKYAEYIAQRERHELGMLTPSFSMLSESLKTVQQPFPVLTSINNGIRLVRSLFHPEDWFDEKQSGPYKGLSTLETNFLKAPIKGVAQFKQIEKFTDQIDNSILFYARPN